MRIVLQIGMVLLVIGAAGVVAACQAPAASVLERAPSAAQYPGMEAVILLDSSQTVVRADGSSVTVLREQLRILTQQGIQDYGEVQIPYDTQLDRITLDYARTISPDGTVDVPAASAIHEVTPSVLSDAPMYSSTKLYTISMPGLQPGAIIDWQATISDKQDRSEPRPPSFDGIWYFSREVPTQRSTSTVVLPRGTGLRWQGVGADVTPAVQTGADAVTYTFTKTDVPAVGYEPYMPDMDAVSSGVILSTLSSWDEIASWYADLAQGCYRPDEAIRAEVKALTDGMQTASGKLGTTYDFVAQKIRYVGLEFGVGRYQPHEASEVFANRYGDCKDQATLLISMLRTAGIDAYPVLLNVRDGMDVDFGTLPTVQAFDHVIVGVPYAGGWRFLDPTWDTATASYLPQSDRARHGLLVLGKPGQAGREVRTGPVVPVETYVTSVTRATLSQTGSLAATATIRVGGDDDLWYRDLLVWRRPDERETLFGQALSAVIPRAQLARLQLTGLEDPHAPIVVTQAFEKEGFAQAAGGMLLFAIPYPAQLPYPDFFSDEVGQASRRYPLMTVAERLQVETVMSVPAGATVQLPQDKDIVNAVASFSAYYTFADGQIRALRVFQTNVLEVAASDYPLYKQAVDGMLEDASDMVILTQP